MPPVIDKTRPGGTYAELIDLATGKPFLKAQGTSKKDAFVNVLALAAQGKFERPLTPAMKYEADKRAAVISAKDRTIKELREQLATAGIAMDEQPAEVV